MFWKAPIFYFFILFYFILFYFILFYFILFYFILFYFILFYFISFYFLFVCLFVFFSRLSVFLRKKVENSSKFCTSWCFFKELFK